MVCVPLRYVSVTLESKFRVRGAMRGNDGRDAVTGATRGIWDPLPPTVTADERPGVEDAIIASSLGDVSRSCRSMY